MFYRIREKLKLLLFRNDKLKINLLNVLPFWVGAFLVGVVSVVYAKLFGWIELLSISLHNKFSWIFLLLAPICFLLAWWLVIKFSPFARGSGIPQVTAAIELSNPRHHYMVNSLLSIRIVVIKIISSLLMVFGGGMIGREGPTIQIAASIFKKINDYLPDWYPKISRRNMIVTGAAAGLAAAFNTPLGGIVFAIEELTKTHFSFFKSALLTGVIIAGLTALSILGPYLYLGYPALGDVSGSMTFIVIVLAFLTGITGMATHKTILFVINRRDKLKTNFHKFLFVGMAGIFIASLSFVFNEMALGSGKQLIVSTLFSDDKQVEWYVPFVRIVGSIISFVTGAAGGIFAPSLGIGASIGSFFSSWFNLNTVEINLVILCGMAGFLTSITKSPFTSSILVYEMTNSHGVIFYILLAALFSYLVSFAVSKHSLYDHLKHQYISEIHKEESQIPISPQKEGANFKN